MNYIFFDLDGTLARFYEERGCIKQALSGVPGFYSGLKPYSGMVDAVKKLIGTEGISVGIITAVPEHGNAIAEKRDWLKAHGISPKTTIFVDCGDSKSDAVKSVLGFFDSSCVLVDDYSLNLKEWEQNGGTSIKALNEVNGFGWNGHCFNGLSVNAEADGEEIYEEIRKEVLA